MIEPLVSIVLRSMSRPTLARALESLAQQDYARIEVVVVNALGPGHAPAPQSAGRHPVRFVDSDARRTRPEAANAGQDVATGDWVTFLDDDDAMQPTHISGLVAATYRAGAARVIHSLATVKLSDGSRRLFGHPLAMVDLYQFNYIHMSTALWSRELLDLGVRFDCNCETQEDWDFFLQCGQHAHFHFEPLRTFSWYADIGESGTWGGGNVDAEGVRRMVDYVHLKWQSQRDALTSLTRPLLTGAAECAQRLDFDGAQTWLNQLFAISWNDPLGLGIRAAVERASGRLDAAESTLRLAVQIRPRDHRLVYDLAVVLRERGEVMTARQSAEHALKLDPSFVPAQVLVAALAKA